jgi:hypothetical protein
VRIIFQLIKSPPKSSRGEDLATAQGQLIEKTDLIDTIQISKSCVKMTFLSGRSGWVAE